MDFTLRLEGRRKSELNEENRKLLDTALICHQFLTIMLEKYVRYSIRRISSVIEVSAS